MLTIYGSEVSSPSNKVRFMANLAGVEYEYRSIHLAKGEARSPEFLKKHPAGKVPVIEDNGFVLFESNAIVKYLARKYRPELYPSDIEQQAVVDQWMDFISAHVGLAMAKITFNRILAPLRKMEVDQRSLDEGQKFMHRFLPPVDNLIGASDDSYVLGKTMSIVDVNLLATLDPAEASGVDLARYENIQRWRDRLKKEDFYTRCHRSFEEVIQKYSGAGT